MAPWGEHLTEAQDEDDVYMISDDEYTTPHSNPYETDDESDQDDDHDLDVAHGASTSVEMRRAQNAAFELFAATMTEEITEKVVKEAIKSSKDEELSIRDILAKQENSTRITNARDYQTELFQRAKEENIIAVLDTGTGKTHIATLLLRHILDKELEDRAKGAPHKIAFFLVNSVNLVFQQSNVLQCGLDHKVQPICGSMGTSLWSKATWDKHLEGNMVVVCTAQVLVECMMHSFINIRRINLLIFDEAHHAKSDHPFARIIKDYYLSEADETQRPRVFGMTASPVDANVDVRQAAKELEALLHCKIATTSDMTLLANHITRPEEKIAEYDKLKPPFRTPFHAELRERYGDLRVFRKLFNTAEIIASELGPWAADYYWTFAFSEKEAAKTEARIQRQFHKKEDKEETIKKLDDDIAQLQEAAKFVQTREFRPPTPTLEDLSSKVLILLEWLRLYYWKTADARCIVFVERRCTARLLNTIFEHLGESNLHHGILVGSSSGLADENVSLKNQVMTVAKFRRGDLNCLFATSVAEEGLDIPQCNLVVRFDLYKTMIAYVQSRGRARHKNSKYLHMIEKGNLAHRTTVHNVFQAERAMRNFCDGLTSDRLLDNDDVDEQIAKLLASDQGFPTFTEPATGAKLTFRSSLAVLAHFIATLPATNQEVTLQPTYIVDHVAGQFVSEVILPECSPIISMRGHPQRRKALARCSAAYEMCLELRNKGYLDETFLSTLKRRLPAMRNALLAISAKKKDQYPMRIKPEYWNYGFDTIPEEFYLTILDASNGLERPHQPIGLITRQPFPQLPQFPIYLPNGTPSDIVSLPMATAFAATKEKRKLFTNLTLQVYSEIFAKVFEYDEAKMSYWIVPLVVEKTMQVSASDDPESLIDWDQVREICGKGEYRWTPEMSRDFLADKYIVDPNDGGRRFYSRGVAPQFKATDPVPGDAPAYKYMESILDYSISLWAKSRVKWQDVWDRSQPVMEVEKIPFRRNFLAHVEKDEDGVIKNPIAYVCPQPLRISALTTRFVAMCYVFPAIIHRFEAYLTALDACKRLELRVGPALALEAVTKDSENSEEHGVEQIKFKSGMGPNYERLEFMGDCFLKMATSISTFVQQPDESEFEFHVRRMCMLCNKNLFRAAMKYELYEYVRSMAFSRRTWYPEGLKLTKGKGMKRTGPNMIKHQLGDKTIADVCEAFIGAAFMEHNQLGTWDPKNWDEAVKAVKVLVDSEDHVMEKFSDYYAAYEKPKYQVAEATASQLDLAAKIEQVHPYHFKYPRLLRSAFIHPSQAFMWEKIPNYQRLEFLGDALLDQVFIMHMFYKYPTKDPHWLTEHKSPMVSNKFLGALCVSLGFHTHIRQNNAALTSQIRDYVTEVQEAARAAETTGAVDYWTRVGTEPPKCLADVVEAYVAAMFVDSEFDFRVVQAFFDAHIRRFFEDMTLYDHFADSHPVTRLQHLIATNFGCRNWRQDYRAQESVLDPGGGQKQVIAMVQVHCQVQWWAAGSSIRYAKIKAAKMAVEALEGLPVFEFKRRFGCDCVDEVGAEVVEGEEMEAVDGGSGVRYGVFGGGMEGVEVQTGRRDSMEALAEEAVATAMDVE